MEEDPQAGSSFRFPSCTQGQPLDWSPSSQSTYGGTTEEAGGSIGADSDATCLPEGVLNTDHDHGDCPNEGAGRLQSSSSDTMDLLLSDIRSMSVVELGLFLHSKGIPDKYCEVFKSRL